MDTYDEEETTRLIQRPSITIDVHDTRQYYKKQIAVYLILASILFEHVAFYSLGNHLIPTLQSNKTLGWNKEDSSTASYIFSGTRLISTLIFAAASDAKLGRVRIIIMGFVLYLIGYTLLTITSHEALSFHRFCNTTSHNTTSIFNEPCAPWILSTLIFTGIGAGTVHANMAVFGAEQIRELKSISQYSGKYMIAVNIGFIVAVLAAPDKQTENANYYFITCLVAELLLLLAFLLFIISCRYCIHVKAYDSVLTNCIPIVINAFQSWCRHRMDKPSKIKKNTKSSFIYSRTACASSEVEESTKMDGQPPTFLDFAKVANDGKFQDRLVDDVNAFRRAIIVFILLVPHFLIYNQLDSTFFQQGEKMKLPYDRMPVIRMTLADPITIIIGIIILDTFFYKKLDAWNTKTIIITKLVIGMFFASLTMCVAGIVEIFRQKNCIGDDKSDLSIYAQLPQNILMGFSAIFATVASYEYAYFAAPRSLQSLFMSLFFCAIGSSSFISTVYRSIFLKPAYEDPTSNCLGQKESWRYFTYFFILAAMELFFIFIFIIFHRKFGIFRLHPQQMETSQFLRHPFTESNER